MDIASAIIIAYIVDVAGAASAVGAIGAVSTACIVDALGGEGTISIAYIVDVTSAVSATVCLVNISILRSIWL
jgi:hypothetical protein